MPDDHRGITFADIKGALVWLPVIGAFGYGIIAWNDQQQRTAYHEGRIAALESLVSVEAIRQNAIWRTNLERDVREMRAGQGALICTQRESYVVCLPRGAKE